MLARGGGSTVRWISWSLWVRHTHASPIRNDTRPGELHGARGGRGGGIWSLLIGVHWTTLPPVRRPD